MDIFNIELIPLNDSLLQLDNIVLTPHIGSTTIETRKAMAISTVKSMLSY